MKETIQFKLFEQVKGRLKKHQQLVSVLMELLYLTQSQAYRRVKGEVKLTLEEAHVLINTFDLSPIQVFPKDKENGLLQFASYLSVNTSYLDFLQQLHQNIQTVSQLPHLTIQYATNEFPIFYTFLFPNLVKFKIYMWNTTFWKNGQPIKKFALDHISPEEVVLAAEIKEGYLNLSTTEYWNIRLADNTLNQIQYALESGLFENQEDATLICEELKTTMQEVAQMAKQGQKRLSSDSDSTKRGKFQLYLSELPTNIHFLVSHQHGQRLYTTFDNPNFLYTDNKAVCIYIQNWLDNLKNKSILISQTGTRARNQFFHHLTTDIVQLINNLHPPSSEKGLRYDE